MLGTYLSVSCNFSTEKSNLMHRSIKKIYAYRLLLKCCLSVSRLCVYSVDIMKYFTKKEQQKTNKKKQKQFTDFLIQLLHAPTFRPLN